MSISHFINTNRHCTFCKIEGRPSTDETFYHLFFNCPTLSLIHDILEPIFNEGGQAPRAQRRLRWTGCQLLENNNNFARLLHLTIQYFIWDSKLCNRLPTTNWVLGDTIALLDISLKCSRELTSNMLNLNCNISRIWDRLSGIGPWTAARRDVRD